MKEKIDKIIQYTLNLVQWVLIITFVILLLYYFYNAVLNMLSVKYTFIFQRHSFISDYPIIIHGLAIIFIFWLCTKRFYEKSKMDIFLDKQDFKIHIVLARVIVSLIIFFLISIIFKIPENIAEVFNMFYDAGFKSAYYTIFSLIFSLEACFLYAVCVFIIFFIRFLCLAFMRNFNKLLRFNSLALICAYCCCYIYFILSMLAFVGTGLMN